MYIQISQTLLSQMRTFDVDTLVDKLKTVSFPDIYVTYYDTPQKATWGAGVFRIETDGKLKLIDSYWDTSD